MTPDIKITDNFWPDHSSTFSTLVDSVPWDSRMAARRTASFGKPYNYSQISYEATDIPWFLQGILTKLIETLKIPFNNCLLNYYETGDNTMGFHSDETDGLVTGTGVAIVSVGSERCISFRSKADPTVIVPYNLLPGSLLYMDAAIQEHWMHAIKRQPEAGPRISMTWRAFR
jgi:alkylated DNA repair dioxygenase AlkB